MVVPFKYNVRHLRRRWRSTLATLVFFALVVAVFVIVLSLARGLTRTYLDTGDPHNLLVLRKGSMAESSSQITLEDVRRTRFLEGVARNATNEPLASAEMLILISLPRLHGGKAHVQVRGLGPLGAQLRPSVRIVAGRTFQPGRRECIVSQAIARRFANCGLGQSFRSGRNTWNVVGLFDARKTAYDSEIWMDVDEAREAFHRSFYASLLLRPVDEAAATALIERIQGDKQMQLRVRTESDYYREQTKAAAPFQIFGACLAVIMSLGAAFAAMNIMYASVGARLREIGTLRVLGFRRHSIYFSFLLESLAVAALGGALGCLLSWPMNGIATGTFNWTTFAEVGFEFRVTGGLMIYGMLFALVMGALGGLLPARLAARLPVLEALRGV